MCIKVSFSPFHLLFEPPSHSFFISTMVNRILRMTANDLGPCVIPDPLNMDRTCEYDETSLL